MTTIRRVITSALNKIGANSANAVPSEEDINVCLRAFNPLIDSLSNSILNIHTINPYRFMLTPNVVNYTLGPGGDFDIARPMRIERANIIIFPATPGDNPINGIGTTQSSMFESLEVLDFSQYASIVLRQLTSTWPTSLYSDNSFPQTLLRLWPIPQMTSAIELWLWQPLATYESLDDELNLPPGYERYLIYKLGAEIAPEFSQELTPNFIKALNESESVIKTLNQGFTISQPSAAAQQIKGRSSIYAQTNIPGTRSPYVR